MMKVLVLLACVAYAAAVSDHHECGPLERLKVINQWSHIYGYHAHEREDFGRELFDYLFEHRPDAHALFTRVRGDNIYSPEFDAHMARLLGGLDMTISLLNDEEDLQAQLDHLHMQHVPRKIDPTLFTVFEEALNHAIPLHLDHTFDQDAWDACYEVISHGIIGDGHHDDSHEDGDHHDDKHDEEDDHNDDKH